MGDYKPLEEFEKDTTDKPKAKKEDLMMADLNTPESGLTAKEAKFRLERDG